MHATHDLIVGFAHARSAKILSVFKINFDIDRRILILDLSEEAIASDASW